MHCLLVLLLQLVPKQGCHQGVPAVGWDRNIHWNLILRDVSLSRSFGHCVMIGVDVIKTIRVCWVSNSQAFQRGDD